MHKQDKKIQSTMSYVEASLELLTTFQYAKQTNTSYYELFKSRLETVKSHGRQSGYNERLYLKKWEHGSENDTTMEILVWTDYKKQAMAYTTLFRS